MFGVVIVIVVVKSAIFFNKLVKGISVNNLCLQISLFFNVSDVLKSLNSK